MEHLVSQYNQEVLAPVLNPAINAKLDVEARNVLLAVQNAIRNHIDRKEDEALVNLLVDILSTIDWKTMPSSETIVDEIIFRIKILDSLEDEAVNDSTVDIMKEYKLLERSYNVAIQLENLPIVSVLFTNKLAKDIEDYLNKIEQKVIAHLHFLIMSKEVQAMKAEDVKVAENIIESLYTKVVINHCNCNAAIENGKTFERMDKLNFDMVMIALLNAEMTIKNKARNNY